MKVTVRELNGWAPSLATFDADGNLLTVTVQEPRFTPEETAVLLASLRDEARPRGSHGILLSEATDPANENAFEVPEPLLDFAEKKLADVKRKYKERWGEDALENKIFRVQKKV